MRLFTLLFLFVLALLPSGCVSTSGRVGQRDSFPLDPREELAGPFPAEIASGWRALLAGDPAKAEEEFERARSRAPGLAAEIGLVETWVLGKNPERAAKTCVPLLKSGEPTLPLLVACAEAWAARSEATDALALYEQALARAPERKGLRARAAELRASARAELVLEAKAHAEKADWDAARTRLVRAIELDGKSAELRALAGDIERAAGFGEKALEHYREAIDLGAKDVTLREKAAELALELSEHALAVSLFDELAREEQRFRVRAEQARLLFRVANWPAPEREAASSTRLTRAEAARLVWWMIPEVREAVVASGVIASDVVSRPDSRALERALSLGLLDVDARTHRANPDAALALGAGSRLLLRLVTLLSSSSSPPACYGDFLPRSGAEAARVAAACGLIDDREGAGPAPPVLSGPEFTRALDRVRALASAEETGGAGGRSQ